MDALEKILSYRLRLPFTVSRIEISLHWSLLFVALYLLVMFRADPRLGLLVVMALYGSIFLHELGHCWGARKVGGEAREIIMWPLGGLAMIHAPMAPWPQFFSTVTGPAVNLLLALFGLPIFLALGGELDMLVPGGPGAAGLGLRVLAIFIQLNVILLLFNIIPAFPMDGGRLLHAALWPKLGFHKALNVAIIAAIICAGGMVIAGFIFTDLLLAVIGLFVIGGALQERVRLRYGLYDEELAMSAPWASSLSSYEPTPEPQPSRFARWREKRRQKQEEARARKREDLRARLDEVLAKVSDLGLDGLSPEERKFLDYASAELRKERSSS